MSKVTEIIPSHFDRKTHLCCMTSVSTGWAAEMPGQGCPKLLALKVTFFCSGKTKSPGRGIKKGELNSARRLFLNVLHENGSSTNRTSVSDSYVLRYSRLFNPNQQYVQ